jgi:hypothetical protein
MRGKDYNTGLRGVLFEARHYERMGAAVWLYAWLVLRQTHQSGSIGWVLGGAPFSYNEIEKETGFNRRTLERWMRTLRRHGYIETVPAMGGLIVRITKAKKHTQAARAGLEERSTFAGGVRKYAEGGTQSCVPPEREVAQNLEVAPRIGSSSLERSIARENPANYRSIQNRIQGAIRISNQTPNQTSIQTEVQPPNVSQSSERPNQTQNLFSTPAQSPSVEAEWPRQPWHLLAEARLRQQMLRAEREEAVRRELSVGAGPEVKRL